MFYIKCLGVLFLSSARDCTRAVCFLYFFIFLINRNMDIFISEILSLDYEVAKQKTHGYPRLHVVGATETFAESGYCYAFKKNSPWKPKFDLVINRLTAENVYVWINCSCSYRKNHAYKHLRL